MSVSKETEFLPADNLPESLKKAARKSARRNLGEDDVFDDNFLNDDQSAAGAWEEYNPFSVQPFVEGISEYDEYQQAWRMLGFMIDCNTVTDDDEQGSHASGDQGTEDGCARYVLWAAYVDLDYEGGGIGEYQYWDRSNQNWDNSACAYADGGNSRCAKMDCHSDDTSFSLLGFFKHRSYDDWMEQLFKHEGMCVWSEEEYAFMKNARKAWPQGCVDSGSTTAMGNTLYYNIKPLPYGRIGIGLYTDTQCVKEYPSDTDMIESILGNFFINNGGSHDSGDQNYDFSGDSLSDSFSRWNSAFSVWQTCHPCVAYDIENTDGSKYVQNDDYYYYNRNRKLGGEYSAEGDIFECYDDAGYTNVNQCMKFSAKTVMHTATFRDLSLGRTQGTLVDTPLAGYLSVKQAYYRKVFGTFVTYVFFLFSIVALCLSCAFLWRVKKDTNSDIAQTIRESLLVEEGTMT